MLVVDHPVHGQPDLGESFLESVDLHARARALDSIETKILELFQAVNVGSASKFYGFENFSTKGTFFGINAKRSKSGTGQTGRGGRYEVASIHSHKG